MNSTFKKMLEILSVGVIVSIGIAIITKKISINLNWFSVRTLQISFGVVLTTLLFMYIGIDRKDMGPNGVKNLVLKSKLVTIFLLGILIWSILGQPVIPVSVSFEGVAKTTDVVDTRNKVQKTNETLIETRELLLGFKQEQNEKNLQLKDQVEDSKKKIIELDSDEKIRQNSSLNKAEDLAVDLKKVLVNLTDIKNLKQEVVPSTIGNNKNNFLVIIFISLLLIAISVTSSFFWKDYAKISIKTRRYSIPAILLIFCVLIYCYKFFITEKHFFTEELSEKDTLQSKKTTIFTNSIINKKDSIIFEIPLDTFKSINLNSESKNKIVKSERLIIKTKKVITKLKPRKKEISKKKRTKKVKYKKYTGPKIWPV